MEFWQRTEGSIATALQGHAHTRSPLDTSVLRRGWEGVSGAVKEGRVRCESCSPRHIHSEELLSVLNLPQRCVQFRDCLGGEHPGHCPQS